MRPTVTIKRTPLIATIFGLLIAAIAGTTFSLQRQLAEHRWVEHTLAVRTSFLQALSTLQDAETNQRGFLLTNDQAFLGPYRAAVGRIHTDLKIFDTEVGDNPAPFFKRLPNAGHWWPTPWPDLFERLVQSRRRECRK
ncbi:CHASE3 domain-containing protein [Methylocystis parvus]|uniref:CHASE3 domain-containing protein n=1 Tax=Methylocystis parvus TaxID=134 RepID=A0A6B8MCA4_9HYPH|nr:CHASE3 domain-containing protein [Methylocystis parvus]QGN00016.1 hypothetical protein F7D14_20685 [Methylocystis parvus]WBK02490.1 CHASE3 domain-containing protein [Methylocystis parvus OBBP]